MFSQTDTNRQKTAGMADNLGTGYAMLVCIFVNPRLTTRWQIIFEVSIGVSPSGRVCKSEVFAK